MPNGPFLTAPVGERRRDHLLRDRGGAAAAVPAGRGDDRHARGAAARDLVTFEFQRTRSAGCPGRHRLPGDQSALLRARRRSASASSASSCHAGDRDDRAAALQRALPRNPNGLRRGRRFGSSLTVRAAVEPAEGSAPHWLTDHSLGITAKRQQGARCSTTSATDVCVTSPPTSICRSPRSTAPSGQLLGDAEPPPVARRRLGDHGLAPGPTWWEPADGTPIAFTSERARTSVVLVGGGATDRSENAPLARELAARGFTAINYDRRGRGRVGTRRPTRSRASSRTSRRSSRASWSGSPAAGRWRSRPSGDRAPGRSTRCRTTCRPGLARALACLPATGRVARRRPRGDAFARFYQGLRKYRRRASRPPAGRRSGRRWRHGADARLRRGCLRRRRRLRASRRSRSPRWS